MQKRIESGKGLPRGWENKIQKGEVLDHEIYRHAKTISAREAAHYGGTKAGEKIMRIEDKIFRIQEGSGMILDVLKNR